MYASMLLLALVGGPVEKVKLADAGWLAGTWKNDPSEKMVFEESWSVPGHGSMVGTSKLVNAGKAVLYEFELIEEDAEGVCLRLRHYGPSMVDRDEKPVKLRLTEATDRKLVWTNPDGDKPKQVLYERDGADKLTVTVDTMRGDKTAQLSLKFIRVGAK